MRSGMANSIQWLYKNNCMKIQNEKGETIAEVNEKGEITAVEGKESEALNGVFGELNAVKKELIEAKKQLNVASVLEKSIREGLIK